MTIQPDVALYFARQFRAARAQVQRDAEGYVAVAIAVEQLGAALGAKGGTCEAQKVIVNTLSLDSDWTRIAVPRLRLRPRAPCATSPSMKGPCRVPWGRTPSSSPSDWRLP